jgi:hypothetical protein
MNLSEAAKDSLPKRKSQNNLKKPLRVSSTMVKKLKKSMMITAKKKAKLNKSL